MGRMLSSEREIAELSFKPFPTRPTKMKIVRAGGYLIGIDDKGNLYTNSQVAMKAAFAPGMWSWSDATINALVKLGVVSQDVVDRHIEDAIEQDKNRDRKDAIKKLERIGSKFGVKFTQAQLKKIKG